jgi:hypothetical protein
LARLVWAFHVWRERSVPFSAMSLRSCAF